jgi:Tol biopolymer transport system component
MIAAMIRRGLLLVIGHWSLIVSLLAACGPGRLPDNVSITLLSDGETKPLTLPTGQTVRDALKAASITLGELDRVRPSEITLLQNGMTITVTRVVQTTEVVTQTIPFSTRTQPDTSLPPGEQQILQAGRNGTLEITYRLTYEDGQQVGRDEIDRQTVATPVPEITRIGPSDFSNVPVSGTIVYLSNQDAYVMREVAGNKRRLTLTADLDGHVFALSPDGHWLLFTRAVTTTFNSLWVVDTTLARSEPRSLSLDGVLWAGFSPDGQSIAYSQADPSPGPPGWRARNDLSTASFSGGRLGNHKQILPPSADAKYAWWGTQFAWSPDSTRLAYANTEAIGVISPSARITKTVELLRFAAFNTRSTWAWTPTPSWSPDGRFIVSAVHAHSPTGESDEDSPAFDVDALAVDSSLTARLVSGAGMWAAPDWLTGDLEASRIIYGQAETPYASDTSHYQLFSMDRDGSNHAPLFPDSDAIGLDGLPDYSLSPDGRNFVVVYQNDLYVVNIPTGTSRQLTAEGSILQPHWSN